MWRAHRFFIYIVVIVGLSLLFAFSGHTYASTGTSPDISFEGKIVNTSGINISDGTYNMEFKIYSGGTSSGGGTLEWTEDYLVGSSEGGITFSSGTFQANLGSVCPFTGGPCETYTNSAINWDTYPLYLSLQIGNTASCTVTTTFQSNCGGDGEMSPYILLTSTPYSFNSSELGGLSSAAYAQVGSANTFSSTNTFNGATTVQPTTNAVGLTVLQNSSGAPTDDIFDVQTVNNSNAIQVTGPSLNTANIAISAVGTDNNVTINPAGTGSLNLGTIASANTIQIGSTTLASGTQTINIGNDNTAGGTTNVTIGDGSSAAAGNTTVQANTTLALNGGNTTDTLQNGSDVIKSSANSSTAFEVQNASGTNLIQTDTQNGDTTISNGTNQPTGTIGTWSSTTTLTTAVSEAATVTYRSYIYQLGGSTTGAVGGATSLSYYAPITSNGTVGSWTATTSLPSTGTGVWGASAVAYNNYLYEWGGTNAAGAMQPTVYYAPINANGSLGAWAAAGNNPANASFGNVGVALNGYIYQIGDATSSAAAGAGTASYYAAINANGTLGTWTSTSAVTAARYLASVATYNGYVYFIGGANTTGTTQTSIYYSQPSSTGLGAFSTATTGLTTAVEGATSTIQNGYLTVLGGSTTNAASGSIATTYIVPIANNGNITSAFTTTTALTTAVYGASSIASNGFIYELGGENTSAATINNIYYGYLFNSSDNDFVSVNANGTQISDTTNSTTTFQVQNAAGMDMIQADSLNGQIILSNGTDVAGTIASVWTNANDLPTALSYTDNVTYNGYVYELGGSTSANNACATAATGASNLTYYAPINANGSVGTWTATTVLPTAVCGLNSVAYNGYMYEWGGAIAAGTTQATVEYAPINANGSLGTWAAADTGAAPAASYGNVGLAYNGYMYQIGSATTDAYGGATTATYYAAINANGTLGAWATSTALTAARYMPAVDEYNGYVYVIGGGNSTAGTAQTTIYYAPLSAGVGAWATATTALTTAVSAEAATMQFGYLTILGGTTTNAYGGGINSAYSVPVNLNGNITGSFVATTPIPNAKSTFDASYYNGYIYEFGGVGTTGTVDSAAFYIPVYSGGQNTLTDNNQGVAVASSVNTTAALQVQNASGTSLLTVDTVDGLVNIGTGSAGDSVGYLLVLDSKNTSGDPTEINGAMYYNASSGDFRCGEEGLWENCLTGLIYSNTTTNTVASCASVTTCAPFTNAISIPSGYCQPGRAITLTVYGVYSSTATVTFGIGVYWGTSATKASDTLIGANSTAVADGAAKTNDGWRLQYTMICDTIGAPGTITGEGLFTLDTAAGTSLFNNLTTAGSTSVTNNAASEIQIFPQIGTDAAGDSMTVEAMTVTGG